MPKQNVGIIGLGVMGENLALNIESRGFSVAGFDLDGKKVDSFASRTQGKKAVAAGPRPSSWPA
jgi:6-phosphogluconate dehydrogenase